MLRHQWSGTLIADREHRTRPEQRWTVTLNRFAPPSTETSKLPELSIPAVACCLSRPGQHQTTPAQICPRPAATCRPSTAELTQPMADWSLRMLQHPATSNRYVVLCGLGIHACVHVQPGLNAFTAPHVPQIPRGTPGSITNNLPIACTTFHDRDFMKLAILIFFYIFYLTSNESISSTAPKILRLSLDR